MDDGPKLGVDIGRVIIAATTDGDDADTSFLGAPTDEDAVSARVVDGAFASLARLTARFEGRVWLVSKCGPKIERRTRTWLDHNELWRATGIARDHLRFCRDRKEKALVCVGLGVDFFVDDRLDVLVAMKATVAHRVLFGAASAPEPDILPAPTWTEAEAWIEGVLDEEERVGAREPPATPTPHRERGGGSRRRRG